MWLRANRGAAVVRPFSPPHSWRQNDSCIFNHSLTVLRNVCYWKVKCVYVYTNYFCVCSLLCWLQCLICLLLRSYWLLGIGNRETLYSEQINSSFITLMVIVHWAAKYLSVRLPLSKEKTVQLYKMWLLWIVALWETGYKTTVSPVCYFVVTPHLRGSDFTLLIRLLACHEACYVIKPVFYTWYKRKYISSSVSTFYTFKG